MSSTGHELPLGRLEALSDGVFAIALFLAVPMRTVHRLLRRG